MQIESEQKQAYETLKLKTDHPFLKRYIQMGMKEALFSDSAGAIGRMHDTLVATAWPQLIGREIITVKPTKEAIERFPLDVDAVAYRYAEGAMTRLSGKKYSTINIHTDILAEAAEEWTREFLEDATWNVMDSMVEKVGWALGRYETQAIINLYNAIASTDLAGGAAIDNAGAPINWAGVVKLHNAVCSENWTPTVLVLHEVQRHQLLNDEKFIHAQYLPSRETDIERGVVTSVLGMKVLASTLVPNGVAFAIDAKFAAMMLLRRDVTVEDWEDVKTGKYGVRATTRFGLGVLRSKAVAKMINISTSL